MGHPSRLGLIDSQEPIERDHPLNAGLVAWWLGLEGNWGGSTLHDLCGKYPGTLTNGPAWSPGPHGFAGLTFDGSNDYVACGTQAMLVGDFTLTTLTRFTALPGGGNFAGIFCKRTTFAGGAFEFFYNSNAGATIGLAFWWGNSFAYKWSPGVTLSTGQWYHLAVTRSGSNFAMYRDGVSVATTTNANAVPSNTEAVVIGQLGLDAVGSAYALNGRNAEVRVHDRALPAAEVYALYEQSLRGHPDTLRRYSTAAWFVPPAAGGSSDGTLSVTLAAPTLSAAGTAAVAGAATPALTAPTLSAAGTVAVVGAATVTLVAPTPTSAGTVAVAGAAAPTLAAPTLSAAGAVAVVGAATPTLTAPASTAAGTVAVVGTLSAALAAPTLTAAGTSGSVGTATITLAAPTSTAAGTVAVAGETTPTLTAPAPTAAGTVAVAGSATPALAVPTLTAAGTVSLSGSAGVTLALPALAAAGAVAVTAELAAALAGYSLTAAGTVAESSGLTATLAVTLDGPALLAAGRGRRRAFDPAGDMALFDADRSMIDPSSDMEHFD